MSTVQILKLDLKLFPYHIQVWFTVEAHFHLDGYINSKSCVSWGTEPPQKVLQWPLYISKVTVWCAINFKTITGPYWIEDGEGRIVTINYENYRKIICKFYASVSRRQGIVINQQLFMQDDANPHTSICNTLTVDTEIRWSSDFPKNWQFFLHTSQPLRLFLLGLLKK